MTEPGTAHPRFKLELWRRRLPSGGIGTSQEPASRHLLKLLLSLQLEWDLENCLFRWGPS